MALRRHISRKTVLSTFHRMSTVAGGNEEELDFENFMAALEQLCTPENENDKEGQAEKGEWLKQIDEQKSKEDIVDSIFIFRKGLEEDTYQRCGSLDVDSFEIDESENLADEDLKAPSCSVVEDVCESATKEAQGEEENFQAQIWSELRDMNKCYKKEFLQTKFMIGNMVMIFQQHFDTMNNALSAQSKEIASLQDKVNKLSKQNKDLQSGAGLKAVPPLRLSSSSRSIVEMDNDIIRSRPSSPSNQSRSPSRSQSRASGLADTWICKKCSFFNSNKLKCGLCSSVKDAEEKSDRLKAKSISNKISGLPHTILLYLLHDIKQEKERLKQQFPQETRLKELAQTDSTAFAQELIAMFNEQPTCETFFKERCCRYGYGDLF